MLFSWIVDEIQKFIEEVKSLGYKEKPKYEVLACILKAGLKAIRAKDDGKLEFTPPARPLSRAKVRMHVHTYMLFAMQAPTFFTFGRFLCTYIADERTTSKVLN